MRPLQEFGSDPNYDPDAEFFASKQERDPLYTASLHSPLLTAEQEVVLARAVRAGGPDRLVAREQMCLSNQRLVVSIARKYAHQRVPFQDLVQEGTIGLLAAIERFDPDRNCRFSTYATWWIRQAITRAIGNQERVIRLPIHVQERLHRLKRKETELRLCLEREPTTGEVAIALGVPEATVVELQQMDHHPLSLEYREDGGERDEFGEFLVEVMEPYIAEEVNGQVVHHQLSALLQQKLTPREWTIIELRFGFGEASAEKLSLEDVGKKLKITRERVRQIEEKTLEKLRTVPELCELRALIAG